ncbi:hypothetical protein AKO1_009610 [Acrasis kona]|uniref:Uncharacterized protein n=1 Tax=Acrasis kona TaxID=1008807 RepID=A0AAW2ZLT8_9EUKA
MIQSTQYTNDKTIGRQWEYEVKEASAIKEVIVDIKARNDRYHNHVPLELYATRMYQVHINLVGLEKNEDVWSFLNVYVQILDSETLTDLTESKGIISGKIVETVPQSDHLTLKVNFATTSYRFQRQQFRLRISVYKRVTPINTTSQQIIHQNNIEETKVSFVVNHNGFNPYTQLLAILVSPPFFIYSKKSHKKRRTSVQQELNSTSSNERFESEESQEPISGKEESNEGGLDF